MSIVRKTYIFRLLAILLILVFIIPGNAQVAASNEASTRASDYLSTYNTYLYQAALGKIRVYYDVTGVRYMDEIGTLSIRIFESTDNANWTWVKTFTNGDTPSMLGSNKIYHSGYVEFQGTIGRYYKAYVCIWAGKDGGGDTRYMWTQPKKATLFAS